METPSAWATKRFATTAGDSSMVADAHACFAVSAARDRDLGENRMMATTVWHSSTRTPHSTACVLSFASVWLRQEQAVSTRAR